MHIYKDLKHKINLFAYFIIFLLHYKNYKRYLEGEMINELNKKDNERSKEMEYQIKPYEVHAGHRLDRNGRRNTTMRKQYEIYINGEYHKTTDLLRDAKRLIELDKKDGRLRKELKNYKKYCKSMQTKEVK